MECFTEIIIYLMTTKVAVHIVMIVETGNKTKVAYRKPICSKILKLQRCNTRENLMTFKPGAYQL